MMGKGVLLILVLMGVLFVSLTVGTLSNYETQSTFGVDIVAAPHEVR